MDYPVLDNLPINKWKVAELKEELKRRNLATKGLKDDLVKRLSEAICKETESVEVEESKDSDGTEPEPEPEPANGSEDTQPEPNPVKFVDNVKEHHQSEVTEGFVRDTDSARGPEDTQQDPNTDDTAGETKHIEAPVGIVSVAVEFASAEIVSSDQSVEVKIDKEHKAMNSSQDKDVVEVSVVQGSSTVQDVGDMKFSSSDGVLEDNLRRQENDVEVTQVASKKALENDIIKSENEGVKLSGMDAESDMSDPTTQVYEANANLGFQVKSDSFSSDSLPINENKDLNDNLNADNVKIEIKVVRQETELQSSSKDLSDVGSSHPLDDQMPHEMQGPVGETDDDKSSNVKFSMKNDNADMVSIDVAKVEHVLENKTSNNSEQTDLQFENAGTLGDVVEPKFSPKKIEASVEDKHDIAASNDDRKDFSKIADVVDGDNMETINLDQSSADDSMEEDVVETKHVDVDQISKEERDTTEETITGMKEAPKVRESGSSDGMQIDIPTEKAESTQETKNGFPELSEKRKFQDEIGGGSKEPAKRPRRWNTESVKTAEPQNASMASPKNLVQTNPVKPIFGRTNSTVGEDAIKERIVPKSSKTATNSLKIENFLRPFTLKAVQELLAKTGEVCSFWMDHIKTHCYVTYSSVEEAIETRNSVYNLQWPPKGGRLLVADFVDPEEVQFKIEGREPASPPKVTIPAVLPAPSSVQTAPARQQVPPAPYSGQTPLARQQVPLAPSSVQTAPPRQQGRRQQVELEHPFTRQLAAPSAPPPKERLPSPVADKNDPPIITLDDLFRKTKATPRVYYLPLSDEEVAKKLAIRGTPKN